LKLVKLLVVVALLGMPLLVITAMPRFFELVGSVPAVHDQPAAATPTPGFTLTDPAPTSAKARFGALDETPPPTLAPPAVRPTAVGTAPPTPTGERVSIGNTGGLGAVLRADPVSGRPVAALHEQQVLDVLERRNVPGSGDWVRVRTADGLEGWVTGIVARQLATPAPASN